MARNLQRKKARDNNLQVVIRFVPITDAEGRLVRAFNLILMGRSDVARLSDCDVKPLREVQDQHVTG